MDRHRALLLLACCAALARAGVAFAQGAAAPGRGDGIRVNYKNAPIATVVSDLARATGVSLIYGDAVTALGNVTIEGPPQVSRAEALAMIDSLLLLRGFAAVPGPGGVRKIIAINGSPSAWTPSGRIPASDAPVTTLLRLENANAADFVQVLTPYLGANATATAFDPTNSLILSGPASLLRSLRLAIAALDQVEAGAPLIWPLRVARADTVADQLKEIAGDLDVPFISSDPRTNAILLRVRPGETEHVRELVDRLDRPAHGAANVQVLKLRYADPKDLAQQLVALQSGTGAATAAGAARRAGLRGLPFQLAADLPTHSLVVSGPPETIDAVLDVVSELDRVPASVRVQITVASVDVDDSLDLGINYLIPTLTNPKGPGDLVAAVFVDPSGGGFTDITNPSSDPFFASFTRAPLLLPIVDPVTGAQTVLSIPEGGAISLNGRTVKADVLMRPNLLITSGHDHEIFAGDNVPIPVSQPSGTGLGTLGTGTTGTGTTGTEATTTSTASGTGNAAIAGGSAETGTTGTGTTGTTGTGTGLVNSTLSVRQNIERKDVGTRLRVTPTVGDQGGVTLKLDVEVSSLAASVAGDVTKVGPTIKQTRIESTIRLLGGEIAVIATAAQPQLEKTKTGIPWMMDIPVLGWAFRKTSDHVLNHHLLIAARAEILRPESRDLADRFARELGGNATAARTH
jgi:general secretion pathway protein D